MGDGRKNNPEWLAERLLQEGRKTDEFFRALSPEQLEVVLYTDGSCWKVKELLAHFLATEMGIFRLIEAILEGSSGIDADFDLDGYNERKVTQLRDVPTNELSNRFLEKRHESANLVASLNEEDLRKEGRHPFLGIAPLEDMIKLLYRHNQIHQRDVRLVLSGGE
jgi:hypothetical protein